MPASVDRNGDSGVLEIEGVEDVAGVSTSIPSSLAVPLKTVDCLLEEIIDPSSWDIKPGHELIEFLTRDILDLLVGSVDCPG